MRGFRAIRSRVASSATAWFLAALLVWPFLLTPYAIATHDCVLGDVDERDHQAGKVECLKPVAQDLREDANIATYATATVAAIIALQLANRGRSDTEPGRDGDGSV